MVELTTGYVAGIIAVGVVFAQLWFPTAITFFLAGHLSDQATAATWTVASRALQNSYWPLILQGDSSRNAGVHRSVVLLAVTIPCLAVLVSIAGIVTPMGLYERDELSSDWESTSFEYVADASAFSQGTSSRDDRPFTRSCVYGGYRAPCPYTSDTFVFEYNGSSIKGTYPTGLNATVPDVIREMYSSGTKNRKTTVANFFDIEWRQLTSQFDMDYNDGKAIAAGIYRYLESFLVSDEIQVVEGLVVDAKDGGIGFRNHTLPVGQSRGTTWSEDLLFLEPDVECVAMNLSIDFQVTMSPSNSLGGFDVSQMNLTDRGGFLNLSKERPFWYRQNDAEQPNRPNLKTRAYQGAWMTNFLTMLLMNVTDAENKTLGTRRLERIDSTIGSHFEIPMPTLVPEYVQGVQYDSEFGEPIGFGLSSYSGSDYPNPYDVTVADFKQGRNMCEGWQYTENGTYTWQDLSTRANNSYVSCLVVRGAPERTDGGPENLFEHESRWSAPMYTCASAVKATIKTVTFFHNSTNANLDSLVVREIQDKNYGDEADMPLWGFENWFMTLDDFQPIWGLVDASLQGFPNVSTLRAPEFYLLNWGDSRAETLSSGLPKMNLPGAIAPLAAFETLASSTGDSYGMSDYTGRGSMNLWLRWKRLSRSSETMSEVIKLLWTDMMASAVVGSKGVLGSRNLQPDMAPSMQTRATQHRIKYRWAFGVPAFVVLLCIGLVFVVVAASILLGRSNLDTIRRRLNQGSLGRVVTAIYFPEESNFSMSSMAWSSANGGKQIDMSIACPVVDVVPESQPLQAQVEQSNDVKVAN